MITGKSGPIPSDYVPDVLKPDLGVVFCGTALGRVSAQKRAYYAHPGNLFWRTLHEVGLTPERIVPQDYERVLEMGIGLTDLSKSYFGNDADLPTDAFDVEALREKVRLYRPRLLAFTSKTAASAFLARPTGLLPLGEQRDIFEGTRLFVLPSPSGQARRFWDIRPWQAVADAFDAK